MIDKSTNFHARCAWFQIAVNCAVVPAGDFDTGFIRAFITVRGCNNHGQSHRLLSQRELRLACPKMSPAAFLGDRPADCVQDWGITSSCDACKSWEDCVLIFPDNFMLVTAGSVSTLTTHFILLPPGGERRCFNLKRTLTLSSWYNRLNCTLCFLRIHREIMIH